MKKNLKVIGSLFAYLFIISAIVIYFGVKMPPTTKTETQSISGYKLVEDSEIPKSQASTLEKVKKLEGFSTFDIDDQNHVAYIGLGAQAKDKQDLTVKKFEVKEKILTVVVEASDKPAKEADPYLLVKYPDDVSIIHVEDVNGKNYGELKKDLGVEFVD